MLQKTIIFFSIILFSSFYSPSNEERIEAKYQQLKSEKLQEELLNCLETVEVRALRKFEKELELIDENTNKVNTEVSRKPKPSISTTSKLPKSKKTE
jgi:hypothetical protein